MSAALAQGARSRRSGPMPASLQARATTSASRFPTEIVPVDGLTDDDARLYGILLGDGHLSEERPPLGRLRQSGARRASRVRARAYLQQRGVHFWEIGRGETNVASALGGAAAASVRDATTGSIVGDRRRDAAVRATTISTTTKQRKRIAPRFAHLPRPQTLALVRGLLETDGGVSRGAEIYFTSSSQPLAEGLRYQCCASACRSAASVRDARCIAHRRAGRRLGRSFNGRPTRSSCAFPPCPRSPRWSGASPIAQAQLDHPRRNGLLARARR